MHEADHSPPSNAKFKNAWSCVSTPPSIFMVWYLIKHRNNFTSYLCKCSFDLLVLFSSTWSHIYRWITYIYIIFTHILVIGHEHVDCILSIYFSATSFVASNTTSVFFFNFDQLNYFPHSQLIIICPVFRRDHSFHDSITATYLCYYCTVDEHQMKYSTGST
jgi:hypothetical protein